MNIFFSNYQLFVFYLQQFICNLINVNINFFSLSSVIALFIAGFFTSLNPCFLSVLPLSISYINIKGNKNLSLASFSLGLSTGFMGIVLLIHIFSSRSSFVLLALPILSSFIFIIIALSFLQILDIYRFYINFFSLYIDSFIFKSNISEFTVGIICSMSTLPCSTPIIITVLFWLSNIQNNVLLFIYIAIFFIGNFFFLFCILTLFVQSMNFSFVLGTRNIIFQVSGFVLLFTGTLSLLEKSFS